MKDKIFILKKHIKLKSIKIIKLKSIRQNF
jgi:hypothetical protein